MCLAMRENHWEQRKRVYGQRTPLTTIENIIEGVGAKRRRDWAALSIAPRALEEALANVADGNCVRVLSAGVCT